MNGRSTIASPNLQLGIVLQLHAHIHENRVLKIRCIVSKDGCAQRMIIILYHRSGFECVVKQLRMVLYKPDCDFNDCELPNEKATPSIFSYRGVACEAACR